MDTKQDPALLAKMKDIEARKAALMEGKPADPVKPEDSATAQAAAQPSVSAPNGADKGSEPKEKEIPQSQAGTPDWYRDEVNRMTRELRERDGRHGAVLQSKEQELAALREELRKAGSGDRGLPKQEPAKGGKLTAAKAREIMAAKRPDLDLSVYDDDDLINWALPHWERLQESDSDLRQTVEQMQAQNNYNAFSHAVEKLAGGFMAANGDPYAGIPGDPAWAAYLSEPVFPGSRQSIGEWLSDNGTVETTAHHFGLFKKRSQAPARAPTSFDANRPTREGQVAPEAAKASGATADSAAGKRYDRAEVDRFRSDLRERRIPYDEANQKRLREFQIAEMEGRVAG